jgi:hypothetical protein
LTVRAAGLPPVDPRPYASRLWSATPGSAANLRSLLLAHSSVRIACAPGVDATLRANVPIDWTMRENVCAHLRVLVRRILRKNGYPPDKQEQDT